MFCNQKMMSFKVALIVLLSTGGVLSQYDSMYIRPNTRGVSYENTRQEIVNNFLNNKPLLNYVPVYNTEYGQWNGNPEKSQKIDQSKKARIAYQALKPKLNPDMDFKKLSDVITRLKTDMQALSHQTKHAYDDKVRELDEVKKLNEDLKVALQNTDVLKNSLYEHEKQLTELEKNIQDRNGYPGVSPSGVEEFLNMIENLELMVRNISYKYGGKLGM